MGSISRKAVQAGHLADAGGATIAAHAAHAKYYADRRLPSHERVESWDPERLTEGISIVVHTAYHLSAIRQLLRIARSPNHFDPNRGLRRMMSISPRVRFMPLAAAGALLLTSTAFADQPVEVVYDGKVIVEGHFEKPHDKV